MQAAARTSSAGTAYSSDDVIARLLRQTGQHYWTFDRIDANGNQTDLTGLVDFSNLPDITFDSTAAIARTLGRLRVRSDGGLLALSDVVRAHYRLLAADGGWLDFVLGTFTVMPGQKDTGQADTWRQFGGHDFGQLLTDATFGPGGYAAPAGSTYIQAVREIVSGYGGRWPIEVQIADPGTLIPSFAGLGYAAMGALMGESRLSMINKLLAAISYVPAWFDELGVMRSSALPDYRSIQPAYVFDSTAGTSLLKIPARSNPDLSRVYNRATVVVDDISRGFIVGSYSVDPASPVSSLNWRDKPIFIKDPKLANQDACDRRARYEVQSSVRLYTPVTFTSFPWPLSQREDFYGVVLSTTDEGVVNRQYVERKWSMKCGAEGETTHEWLEAISA